MSCNIAWAAGDKESYMALPSGWYTSAPIINTTVPTITRVGSALSLCAIDGTNSKVNSLSLRHDMAATLATIEA